MIHLSLAILSFLGLVSCPRDDKREPKLERPLQGCQKDYVEINGRCMQEDQALKLLQDGRWGREAKFK